MRVVYQCNVIARVYSRSGRRVWSLGLRQLTGIRERVCSQTHHGNEGTMEPPENLIDEVLSRVYAAGQANDNSATDRADMAFNITPSTGRFLDAMITDSAPKRILEIGTSTGYSTIWLARAVREIGAKVDS